jgi:hypothetical protein
MPGFRVNALLLLRRISFNLKKLEIDYDNPYLFEWYD